MPRCPCGDTILDQTHQDFTNDINLIVTDRRSDWQTLSRQRRPKYLRMIHAQRQYERDLIAELDEGYTPTGRRFVVEQCQLLLDAVRRGDRRQTRHQARAIATLVNKCRRTDGPRPLAMANLSSATLALVLMYAKAAAIRMFLETFL